MSQDEKEKPEVIQVLDDKELDSVSGGNTPAPLMGTYFHFPQADDEDT